MTFDNYWFLKQDITQEDVYSGYVEFSFDRFVEISLIKILFPKVEIKKPKVLTEVFLHKHLYWTGRLQSCRPTQ